MIRRAFRRRGADVRPLVHGPFRHGRRQTSAVLSISDALNLPRPGLTRAGGRLRIRQVCALETEHLENE